MTDHQEQIEQNIELKQNIKTIKYLMNKIISDIKVRYSNSNSTSKQKILAEQIEKIKDYIDIKFDKMNICISEIIINDSDIDSDVESDAIQQITRTNTPTLEIKKKAYDDSPVVEVPCKVQKKTGDDSPVVEVTRIIQKNADNDLPVAKVTCRVQEKTDNSPVVEIQEKTSTSIRRTQETASSSSTHIEVHQSQEDSGKQSFIPNKVRDDCRRSKCSNRGRGCGFFHSGFAICSIPGCSYEKGCTLEHPMFYPPQIYGHLVADINGWNTAVEILFTNQDRQYYQSLVQKGDGVFWAESPQSPPTPIKPCQMNCPSRRVTK